METSVNAVELLVERAEEYGKSNIELCRLKAIALSADIVSSLVSKLVVAASFLLFFLILNIGVALWIGDLVGHTYIGFFAVAGLYAIIGMILYAFRDRWVKAPLRNSIINQSLN